LRTLVLSFPQLQLFCIVLASKTLQTLPKEEEEEEEKHNRVVGLGQILCSLLALHQIFRQLDRERLEKIRAAASSFITWRFVQPIKTVPTQKNPGNKKKRNNKNCKNLTSSSLSLSPPKANTKTPTNSPKQKAITKTSKTHTTSSKTPPPTTKISSKRMYVQNFLNTLLHLPFATITHQNSQTHQNQSIDLHSKKEEEEEEEGNKTQQNTQRVERQKREERERERGFD